MDYLQYLKTAYKREVEYQRSFKPCYKWITFNISDGYDIVPYETGEVLNLVINGLPSIFSYSRFSIVSSSIVLNLVINGLPSIF